MSVAVNQIELDRRFVGEVLEKVKDELAVLKEQREVKDAVGDLLPINALAHQAAQYRYGSRENAIKYLRAVNGAWHQSSSKPENNGRRDSAFITLAAVVVRLAPEKDAVAKEFCARLRISSSLRTEIERVLEERAPAQIQFLSATPLVATLRAPVLRATGSAPRVRRRLARSVVAEALSGVAGKSANIKSDISAGQIIAGAQLPAGKSLSAQTYLDLQDQIAGNTLQAKELVRCQRAISNHLTLVKGDPNHATGFELGTFQNLVVRALNQDFAAISNHALVGSLQEAINFLSDQDKDVLRSTSPEKRLLRAERLRSIYTFLRYRNFSHQRLTESLN